MLNKDLKKKSKRKKVFLSFLKEFTCFFFFWSVKGFILCTISGKKFRAPDSLTDKYSNDSKNS